MQIKAIRQPQPQRVPDHSFDQLKKQCTLYGLGLPPNLDKNRSKKNHQYLQVNYIKDFVYKISPALHSKVPLQKEQQNLRDYLLEVQNDSQKHHQINNELKHKYFNQTYLQNITPSRKHGRNNKRLSHPLSSYKSKHDSLIQFFDPIECLEQKQTKKKKLVASKIKKLQDLHMFCENVDSVKFLSEAPDIKMPEPLPTLTNKSSRSFIDKTNNTMPKNNNQIAKSISQIMEKSVKYQSPSKNGPKKLKHYRSRNQLNKANDKKIKTERTKIMNMIKQQRSVSSHMRHLQPMSLNQIPAKQKYAIDFTSYLRTKTKDQLDKYIYEKLVKKPQKDLEKFQEFILKEVKFENEQNKHKIERFFIKMRQQFRRIEKYSQQGSKFDWRSKSMHLDEMKKEDQNLAIKNLLSDNLRSTGTHPKSVPKKFKSARQRFLKIESIKRKLTKQQEQNNQKQFNQLEEPQQQGNQQEE